MKVTIGLVLSAIFFGISAGSAYSQTTTDTASLSVAALPDEPTPTGVSASADNNALGAEFSSSVVKAHDPGQPPAAVNKGSKALHWGAIIGFQTFLAGDMITTGIALSLPKSMTYLPGSCTTQYSNGTTTTGPCDPTSTVTVDIDIHEVGLGSLIFGNNAAGNIAFDAGLGEGSFWALNRVVRKHPKVAPYRTVILILEGAAHAYAMGMNASLIVKAKDLATPPPGATGIHYNYH